MAKVDSDSISCPNCRGPLAPVVMGCRACDLKIEAEFTPGPLAALSAEQLRFVQLFIHCEGSIREMEKAMGVSYPTVKAKLADVKAALANPAEINDPPRARPAKKDLGGVLSDLQAGNIEFDEAMKLIRKLKT